MVNDELLLETIFIFCVCEIEREGEREREKERETHTHTKKEIAIEMVNRESKRARQEGGQR